MKQLDINEYEIKTELRKIIMQTPVDRAPEALADYVVKHMDEAYRKGCEDAVDCENDYQRGYDAGYSAAKEGV